jgi:hypothetical protein
MRRQLEDNRKAENKRQKIKRRDPPLNQDRETSLILLSTDVTNILVNKIGGNYQNHTLVVNDWYL